MSPALEGLSLKGETDIETNKCSRQLQSLLSGCSEHRIRREGGSRKEHSRKYDSL